MQHEQEARERQNLYTKITLLETMLHNIESDWAKCAKTGMSPCFFCAHDDTCECSNDAECNFQWKSHD